MIVLVLLTVLVALVAAICWRLWLGMPVPIERDDITQLRRDTAEAAWKIHRRAAETFGDMLDAARDNRDFRE